MATLHKRMCRGHAYWSIVESRRVNGKPRPVILEYIGTPESLLNRLQKTGEQKIKTYSHGLVATFLDIAHEFNISQIINKYVDKKQIRNNLTVGDSILLAAIGRIGKPTSKKGWYEGWAKHTSLSYLLRQSLVKIDSQHFWDQMDLISPEVIPHIYEEIVKQVIEKDDVKMDALLYDTTNFFTYISSTNTRCSIAERGKNKQRRADLKQFGLLLSVSKNEHIPIFHKVYQGNINDAKVFNQEFEGMLNHFEALTGSLETMTFVCDQGNHSKDILNKLKQRVHFVTATSPSHNKDLVSQANKNMKNIVLNKETKIPAYRTRMQLWGMDLTAVVYVSPKLKEGQERGLEKSLKKMNDFLAELKQKVIVPTQRGKKRTLEGLSKKINSEIKKHKLDKIVKYHLAHHKKDAYNLSFWIDQDEVDRLKNEWFGRRIVITTRHNWSTKQIVEAYWGQAQIERCFKKMKDPFHLAVRPQFHWTDQKIHVHTFICIIAFLLTMVAYKRIRDRINFRGSVSAFLEILQSIRLAVVVNEGDKKTKGRYKVKYQLEALDSQQQSFIKAFDMVKDKYICEFPIGVYK